MYKQSQRGPQAPPQSGNSADVKDGEVIDADVVGA
jgi:hypothetical protein